ncbi:MAG: universal stress protein [Myxococcota bacterium]
MKIQTILVPTDFSEDAAQAVAAARDLAKLLDARVVVVHAYHVDVPVVSPMAGGYALPTGFYEDLRTHATAQVDEVVKGLVADGVDATGVVVCEPPAQAIAEQAEEVSADLVVMGTRGHTGLKHVVLGSVAERVVRTSPCPVLTVKAS